MAKSESSANLESLKARIAASHAFSEDSIEGAILSFRRKFVRAQILEEGIRLDSRGLDEIRAISIESNILPNAHGSALFTRGETQALAVCTLGGDLDAQNAESLQFGARKQKFMFHYNFPSFCTGEAYPIGSVSRRELGHGNLARKALESSTFHESRTIRIVSEILESNGSSSMASVCAGSLALFAAGLKPQFLVAGIAMGLVKDGEKYAILTDIMGVEDFEGDMDFKVAGTMEGITALQMDLKISDLDLKILGEALLKAKIAREKILALMDAARAAIKLNDNAPKMLCFNIQQTKIPTLIGAKGSNIRQIIERFQITIDIDKESGKVTLNGARSEALDEARDFILAQCEDKASAFKVGDILRGKVRKIAPFGAFIELKNGVDGLLRTRYFEGRILSEGESVEVKISAIKGEKIDLGLVL